MHIHFLKCFFYISLELSRSLYLIIYGDIILVLCSEMNCTNYLS